jgi:hypothetical protein
MEFSDQVNDQCDQQAEYDAACKWEIKRKIAALYIKIAGKFPYKWDAFKKVDYKADYN